MTDTCVCMNNLPRVVHYTTAKYSDDFNLQLSLQPASHTSEKCRNVIVENATARLLFQNTLHCINKSSSRELPTYARVYPSIGERVLSQGGSSISSCRCDDGGSNDKVRSLMNACKHTIRSSQHYRSAHSNN